MDTIGQILPALPERVHRTDTMKLVIAQKMTGNGGQAGDQIMLGLEKVKEKILR